VTDDRERLLRWFDAGELVRPDATVPNTVALVRTLAWLNGVRDAPLDEPSQRIAEAIGEAEHYVFVLADGLGLEHHGNCDTVMSNVSCTTMPVAADGATVITTVYGY
jgi:hypothetical protein